MRAPHFGDGERRLSPRRQHETKLRQMIETATQLADVADRIVKAAEQVSSEGGLLDVEPQMRFVTSAYVRLVKDWAVTESLQTLHRGNVKHERRG